MRRTLAVLTGVLLLASPLTAQPRTERPRAFWTAIVDNGLAVPAGEQPLPLLIELGRHFGSRDGQLRDGCGYAITARWVVREKRLSADDLRALVAAWSPGLNAAADPNSGDVTLFRSFSALGLSLVAARDVEQQALDAAAVDRLIGQAIAQLDANTDHRGFDPEVGWVHVTAHTADLLKFLGRHPALARGRQPEIFAALARRVAAAPAVFAWGEGERLSRAAASLLRRDDVDVQAVDGFLDALAAAAGRVNWDRPSDGNAMAAHENAKAVLKDLYLVLSVAGKDDLRQRVLTRLEKLS